MRAVRGRVPARAQEGLGKNVVARGLFLACQCHPHEDLEVVLPDDAIERFATRVKAVEPLAEDIRGLRLESPAGYDYRPGQFLQLHCDEATARNYSLASVPGLDDEILLHVRRVPGGLVSGWVFDTLRAGAPLMISEARGNCFYVAGAATQDLLLIGTGCGLAPLYGIARDALRQGHAGRIELYHGSRDVAGQYLARELRELARKHPTFFYHPCVDSCAPADDMRPGTPLARALEDHPDLGGWRIFLCGNPKMVEEARVETFLAGAASSAIFADPHLPTCGTPERAGTPC
jgi:ferredoxin-NADP reductase